MSERDAYGRTHLNKQFIAHEPASTTHEAAYSVPRKNNMRLTHSTPHVKHNVDIVAANPIKLTAGSRYNPSSPRRRRQLPPTPNTKALNKRTFHPRDNLYDANKSLATNTTTKEFHGHDGVEPSHLHVSDKTIQPLSQQVVNTRFSRHTEDHGNNLWRDDHGFSEKESVGKLPTFVVGNSTQQLNEYRDSKDLITSLRQPTEKDSWWKPKGGKKGQMAINADVEMPEVFQRLTDTNNYVSTHKNRFSTDGVGLGLEGTTDNDYHTVVQAGKAIITRDIDVEIERPNQPKVPWTSSTSTTGPSRTPTRNTTRAPSRVANYEQDCPDIFKRLATPKKSKKDGEMEVKNKVMKEFGMIGPTAWQSGVN
eukprot:m.34979 g.34979  ORF g.34979 m.34979 type:complete len:365 (+) comp9974_c0_seq1:227-1321(+)